ncbi:lipopolysaccharide assembly protein LapA domain-containing protein [Amaricoccus sp.]|uniref:lipopolysaccharide assembly protein LapA domain-containing protein n=1 Tax=Amaricoccus sp. TaxID=1872485 RepID=UPI0025BA83A4|nr:lipopolysaccharide assembly protein LapA domain-containing protein [Amaricoccus sp.]
MRIIKLILLVAILAGIVVLALANRGPVTLNLLPAGMSGIADRSIEVPLYVVGLVSVLVGMALGYILEWLREHKHRRRASAKTREAAALNREVGRLRKEASKGEDEILALLRN